MLSYTYRSQPSEQQPVPRMWSTQSSTRQEGYLLHPRNGDDNGHGPFSPQPLTDDDFERLHASNHLPPAPSTSSVFTIDPKKLELHASKSSNNGDEPQSHALPPLSPDQALLEKYEEECKEVQVDIDSKWTPWWHLQSCIQQKAEEKSEFDIEALLKQFREQCERVKSDMARKKKWNPWQCVQSCIQNKAADVGIHYKTKPSPDGPTRRVWKETSHLEPLPEESEGNHRATCEASCLKPKKEILRHRCVERCIAIKAGLDGFHYKLKAYLYKGPSQGGRRPRRKT
ncbi:hypothetical protein AX14_012646 [Amanita brunnescens Koide BX004]|nr:hypothetical protein AX14_012646 [Amanita brunnescens Koide BX004]